MRDLVISPEPFIPKCRSLAQAKSIYLEVRDRRIRLACTGDSSSVFMERAESIGLGISYYMLEEALSEAGGTTEVDGRYPINEEIRWKLRKLIK